MTYLRGVRMSRGIALAAADANGSLATASEKANMFNDAIVASYAASIFNETALTITKGASIFNETALSIAKINSIIINANIADDKAQQILSEILKSDRDLTSADNIYEMLDDFADLKYATRDGADTVSTTFTNLFAQKNLFRPEWTVQSGTWNADAGYLTKTDPDAHGDYISTPSDFVLGTWEIEFKLDTNNTYVYLVIMNNEVTVSATSDGYYIYPHGTQDNYGFFKNINGTRTSIIDGGTWADHTIQHTAKVTRNSSGGFELFLDGVSQGTVTNTDVTASSYITIDVPYINIRIDNLKVY